MAINETHAIFTIVFRNLDLPNWANLEPEAQYQMIEEAAGLMKSDAIPPLGKENLSTRLNVLRSYVTKAHSERINQLLNFCCQGQYN